MPTGGTLPWLAYWMVIFQNRVFFFFPPKSGIFPKEVIWANQHALALAACPWGQPWPFLLAYRGCLGLACMPLPWLLPH